MEATKTVPTKKFGNRGKLVVFSIFVVVITLAVILFAKSYIFSGESVNVPDAVTKSAGFSIIQPGKVPAKFNVTREPYYDGEKQLVVTVFVSEDGKKITLSQQKKPKNTDLQQIDAKEKYLTDIGSVYVLKGEDGKQQSIIETSDSWLFVNSDGVLKLTDYKKFIESLEV